MKKKLLHFFTNTQLFYENAHNAGKEISTLTKSSSMRKSLLGLTLLMLVTLNLFSQRSGRPITSTVFSPPVYPIVQSCQGASIRFVNINYGTANGEKWAIWKLQLNLTQIQLYTPSGLKISTLGSSYIDNNYTILSTYNTLNSFFDHELIFRGPSMGQLYPYGQPPNVWVDLATFQFRTPVNESLKIQLAWLQFHSDQTWGNCNAFMAPLELALIPVSMNRN
jgi:hypothetical protein